MKKLLHERTILVRTLLLQGIRVGLWKDRTTCAIALGIPPPTFTRYVEGGTKTGEALDEAIAGLQKKLKDKKDTPWANELFTLYEEGWIQGIWDTRIECAAVIGFSRTGVSKYLKPEVPQCTSREKDFMKEIRTKMQSALKSKKAKKVDVDDSAFPATSSGSPDGGSTNPWLEKALLQLLSQPGQFQDGRFLLTAENFAPWDGTISDASIRDTVALILELQKRLKDIAQVTDAKTRAKCNRELGPALDALFEFNDLLQQVVPAGYLKRLASLRSQLNELRNQK